MSFGKVEKNNKVYPGGVRIGAPAMTTRGCSTKDFEQIGTFLDQALKIASKIQEEMGKKLKDSEAVIPGYPEVQALKSEVTKYLLPQLFAALERTKGGNELLRRHELRQEGGGASERRALGPEPWPFGAGF